MIDHRPSTFRPCMHEPSLHLDIAVNIPARSMADPANFALEVDFDDIGLDPSNNISRPRRKSHSTGSKFVAKY